MWIVVLVAMAVGVWQPAQILAQTGEISTAVPRTVKDHPQYGQSRHATVPNHGFLSGSCRFQSARRIIGLAVGRVAMIIPPHHG